MSFHSNSGVAAIPSVMLRNYLKCFELARISSIRVMICAAKFRIN